jgi:MOSC domain-containing protein YiiM
VPLNHLVGRQFRVGDVLLEGVRLCEPCGHLESLTQVGARQGLIHRGGLRARIVTEGTIRVGDPIEPVVP